MIKSKGVKMTHENHAHINPEIYERLILEATILYVWGGMAPFPDQVMCVYTLPFGYVCKSKLDIQDVFYAGLTAPLW
jgi:hypothetical protein